jgi:hypothetical protein
MRSPLKIANASGFWGDQPGAAARLLAQQPDIDYLTLDYLAEVSLSIMAIARMKDPRSGYARDFVEVVKSLVPFWTQGAKTRVVTNAGGLDPQSCGEAVKAVLASAGLDRLKVAVVAGDDVLTLVKAATGNEFANSETGEALALVSNKVVTANAYAGAGSITEALRAGADIVVTGRVADPSLTVGPCWAHFDWSESDFDRLAGATVAGHLLECGTQAAGGFSTDWLSLPDNFDIGFPIVEMSEDGACVLTKPAGTGGAVTLQTVKEQLLYEIGDPASYLSPDVSVSFLTLAVESAGRDRVRISGATGRPPPTTYKVSATYQHGYKAHGMLTIYGYRAVAKARAAGEGLLRRLRESGCGFRETLVECLGTGASVGGLGRRVREDDLIETVLRISVAADDEAPVRRFTREIAPLVTCGPQGVTGYASGRPKVMPVFGYWPCLIPRELVNPTWRML